MIKCKDGAVQIRGALPEILQDTIHILSGVYRSLIEKEGEEIANEHIAKIGRISVITDTEERDKLIGEYIIGEQEKMLNELPEELRELGAELLGLITDILKEAGDE